AGLKTAFQLGHGLRQGLQGGIGETAIRGVGIVRLLALRPLLQIVGQDRGAATNGYIHKTSRHADVPSYMGQTGMLIIAVLHAVFLILIARDEWKQSTQEPKGNYCVFTLLRAEFRE